MIGFDTTVHTFSEIHAGGHPRLSSPHLLRSVVDLRILSADDQDPCPATEMDGAGGRGLRDCFHGGDGLDLCTESLGSESCDGGLDPEEEEALLEGAARAAEERDEPRRRSREPRKTTGFPPPLRWMSEADGRRAGIIRAERRGGRLVLTEVRIDRPEVFRATREGGRLRLHAVDSVGDEEAPPEENEEEMKEEEQWPEWQRGGGGGEGFKRCQDLVNGKHVEVPVWWNHRFVGMA